MTRLLTFMVLFFISGAGLHAETGPVRPSPLASAIEAAEGKRWDNARALAARAGPVASDVIEWMRLRTGEGTLTEVQRFLTRRADWPGLPLLRRRSEAAATAATPAQIIAYFSASPPRTATGIFGLAMALTQMGDDGAARDLIVNSWAEVKLSPEEQQVILDHHGGNLEPHHKSRLDRLLWEGRFTEARQMLPLVSPDWQALAQARMGLRNAVDNVDALVANVPGALVDHPGLIHDRFEWRARKGRWDEAIEMLLAQSQSAAMLGRPDRWAGRRRGLAREELREGSAQRAYDLAERHFLTEGSAYADLEWLAGYIALTRLNNPEQALRHFENHDQAVRSPISKGRAGYWTGRAWQALGNVARADMAFTRGAAYQTSFYGLLAAEAAGLPFDVGLQDVPQENWQQSPVVRDSLFQAGLLLLKAGRRNLAERFWAHLAEQLGEHDAALLGQAAIDLDDPHLAVMIGKAAARRGAIIPVPYYPLHPLARAPYGFAPEMSLAIARRESEFDPVVQSGVGARGLMQLMPATAKGVARELGIAATHSTGRLTSDPLYNAQLGTFYLRQLAARFDGNPVMIAAAYNAGPARPARWMTERGDPRGKGLNEMIDWIETIPFRETRNYVMRVTESLPIYRARLGRDPLPVPFSEELSGSGFRRFAAP